MTPTDSQGCNHKQRSIQALTQETSSRDDDVSNSNWDEEAEEDKAKDRYPDSRCGLKHVDVMSQKRKTKNKSLYPLVLSCSC